MIRETDRGLAALLIEAGKRGSVTTGIHADEGAKVHDEGDGLTVAEIASIQVYGTADGKIPPRDFVGGYVDEHEAEIAGYLRKAARSVVSGARSAEDALALVGIATERGMKQFIQDGIEPELADSTKERRKYNVDDYTPLIDSGQLIGSISSEVSIK